MQKKKHLIEYGLITVGTTLLAVGLNVFYEPNNIVTGGFTGLAIIILNLSKTWLPFAIPLWLTNLILNVPLFLVGTKIFGKHVLFKTLYATLFLSFALMITQGLPKLHADLILATVFGAVFAGSGLGLVFKCMATTGGTDLLASIIQRRAKHMTVARIMFFLDSTIIAIGFFIFGPVTAMYSVISVFIASKMIDNFLEGLSFAKMVIIISEKSDEIADVILKRTGRGITGLSGTGMYTGENKHVLLCVVSKKELVLLKELALSVDEASFVIVSDVREALGNGFQQIQSN